jgi:prevent-host-death family protein
MDIAMQVAMQEFKAHLAQYVGQAQSGQVIELTSHRKVVARITGVPGVDDSESAGVTRLLASGRASWQGGKPSGAQLVLSESGKPVGDMVLEDRA